MTKSANHRRAAGARALTMVIGVFTVLYAITFLVGSALHLGVQVPLGFAVLGEPRIIPASIVEGLCGLVLLIGAYAVLTQRRRAWTTAVSAHAFALGGVLLGIVALAVGAGPSTELNNAYHLVMVVLISSLGLLSKPIAKAALGHGDKTSHSDRASRSRQAPG